MLNDCNNADDRAATEIKVTLEKGDFDAIDSAWAVLIRALADHDIGSPRQALAWENGMAKMPQPLRDLLPSLARLHDLALKAWPALQEKGEMDSGAIQSGQIQRIPDKKQEESINT